VGYVRGKWADACIYNILREEWKEPKILTKSFTELEAPLPLVSKYSKRSL
jgi:hypothetical protein